MTTLKKIAIVVGVAIVLVLTGWFINGLYHDRQSANLENKIQELQKQVDDKEDERVRAIGERDAYKSQADSIAPKLDELQQRTDQSDSRLGGIQSTLIKERKTYEDAKASRNDANVGIDAVRDDACAELKRAGLVPANDTCK